MRLIDLDEVIDAIESTEWYHLVNGKLSEGAEGDESALYKAEDVYKAIKGVPVVDAEPVRHGKWEYVTVVYEGFWRCSNCGTPSEALGARKLYKYCHFCGAKMDEQEAQNDS